MQSALERSAVLAGLAEHPPGKVPSAVRATGKRLADRPQVRKRRRRKRVFCLWRIVFEEHGELRMITYD
jgi:hypothetical protein